MILHSSFRVKWKCIDLSNRSLWIRFTYVCIIYMGFQTICRKGDTSLKRSLWHFRVMQLCVKAHLSSPGTHRQAETLARLWTQWSHQCVSDSAPKDGGLTEESMEKEVFEGRWINKGCLWNQSCQLSVQSPVRGWDTICVLGFYWSVKFIIAYLNY